VLIIGERQRQCPFIVGEEVGSQSSFPHSEESLSAIFQLLTTVFPQEQVTRSVFFSVYLHNCPSVLLCCRRENVDPQQYISREREREKDICQRGKKRTAQRLRLEREGTTTITITTERDPRPDFRCVFTTKRW